MIKPLFTFLLALMMFQAVNAQDTGDTDTLVCYLNNNNDIVHNKDEAAYLLVVYPRDQSQKEKLYPFRQYYLNGKAKSVGTSTVHSPYLFLEGPLINFFPNGRRHSSMTFKNGKILGNYIQNYSNGKLHSILEYTADKGIFYIECRDTLGNVLADKGNGKWIELDNDYKKPVRYVSVTNGILNRKWYPITDTTNYAYYNGTGPIVTKPNISPQFEGTQPINFFTFLQRNLYYPIDDQNQRIRGEVIVSMVVEKDGTLTHLKVKKAPSSTLAEEAMRLVGLSSPWIPGSATDSTSADRVSMDLTLSFGLTISKNRNMETTLPYINLKYHNDSFVVNQFNHPDTIYSVDQQPEFPGGLEAFGRFLGNNIKYPSADRDNATSGKVFVQFVVEEDGSLSNVQAIRGPSNSMKAEAVRVIRLSPKWKPGLSNNKPVKVSYTVPIAFTIEVEPFDFRQSAFGRSF